MTILDALRLSAFRDCELIKNVYRWLSIVWQFFWTWFYAPYLLWKTRNVRDTHGWRVQTIGCCLCL